ncbi:hypothetical protein LshimejAT787_1101560 [Lyophyllum shimeji]|uniref:Uncharacterized protein n=1 Tax=Lyophyllum shimeji TaxID=47721 RepID=A0A9P3PUY4_LYOSH|nr:hypothetical protein LshimejAT787_1101560 [Lyophyllum shimeji]
MLALDETAPVPAARLPCLYRAGSSWSHGPLRPISVYPVRDPESVTIASQFETPAPTIAALKRVLVFVTPHAVSDPPRIRSPMRTQLQHASVTLH